MPSEELTLPRDPGFELVDDAAIMARVMSILA